MILDEVDPEGRSILERHGFDAEEFERLRAGLLDGTRTVRGNAIGGLVEPPSASDLTELPAPGDHFADRNLRGRTQQDISPANPPLASEDSRATQCQEDLFKELDRNPLLVAQLRDRPGFWAARHQHERA